MLRFVSWALEIAIPQVTVMMSILLINAKMKDLSQPVQRVKSYIKIIDVPTIPLLENVAPKLVLKTLQLLVQGMLLATIAVGMIVKVVTLAQAIMNVAELGNIARVSAALQTQPDAISIALEIIFLMSVRTKPIAKAFIVMDIVAEAVRQPVLKLVLAIALQNLEKAGAHHLAQLAMEQPYITIRPQLVHQVTQQRLILVILQKDTD